MYESNISFNGEKMHTKQYKKKQIGRR